MGTWMGLLIRLEKLIGTTLADILPHPVLETLVFRIADIEPNVILEGFGPRLNRAPNLGNMPFDLPMKDDLQFEHLAGLFASTSLDHAVISMPVRQTAYLFGLIRQMGARKVIEIGRYKGGSTLVIGVAMKPVGGTALVSGYR